MQKEQLSALMDGETLDSELLNELAHNPEMQKTWESYHLIRDSMRGVSRGSIRISSRVMAREEEPAIDPGSPTCAASMAKSHSGRMSVGGTANLNGRSRMRMLLLSLASSTIMDNETSQQSETPVFNTPP